MCQCSSIKKLLTYLLTHPIAIIIIIIIIIITHQHKVAVVKTTQSVKTAAATFCVHCVEEGASPPPQGCRQTLKQVSWVMTVLRLLIYWTSSMAMCLLFLRQWGRRCVCLPAWSTWWSCVVPLDQLPPLEWTLCQRCVTVLVSGTVISQASGFPTSTSSSSSSSSSRI